MATAAVCKKSKGRKKKGSVPITEEELLESMKKLEEWQLAIIAAQEEMNAHLLELKDRGVDIVLFKQALKLWQGEKRETFALYWKLLTQEKETSSEEESVSEEKDWEGEPIPRVLYPFVEKPQ